MDRYLWELCCSFWVIQGLLWKNSEFLPCRLRLIFRFWLLLLSLKGRRHRKVATELKLKSDPLTLLHEPLILFSGMGHTLFAHCKFWVSIHWIPMQYFKSMPQRLPRKNKFKRTEFELPVMNVCVYVLQMESMLSKLKITHSRISVVKSIIVKKSQICHSIKINYFTLC